MIAIDRWRYQRFHISYLLGWFSVGVMGGLLLTRVYAFPLSTIGVCIFLALSLPALRSRRWWVVIVVAFIGVLLGLARGGEYTAALRWTQRYEDTQATMTAMVNTDPHDTGKDLRILQLSSVMVDGLRVPGEIYATTSSTQDIRRGDTVRISGKIKEGFATYVAALSYAKIDSVSRSPDAIRNIRERFSESVHRYVVEPMASLGLGFVVGQRSTLPQELDEQLRVVGLTHIVVASGYNLTILVRFARRLLARRSRYLALAASLTLMLSFAAFSGMSPSMNRAVVVTGLSLLAWYYGRRFHPLLLILYVAGGTSLWSPTYIWSDLGWYLSFFAFTGVLLVAPLIGTLLFRGSEPPAIGQLVIETLSAELMTLPLIALVFGTFPTFGLIANILVGPFIPLAMLATSIAGAVGMVVPALAPLAAVPATVVIGYVVAVVEWLSAFEWAQLSFALTLPIVLAWFLTLAVGIIVVWRKTGYDFRSRAITD